MTVLGHAITWNPHDKSFTTTVPKFQIFAVAWVQLFHKHTQALVNMLKISWCSLLHLKQIFSKHYGWIGNVCVSSH